MKHKLFLLVLSSVLFQSCMSYENDLIGKIYREHTDLKVLKNYTQISGIVVNSYITTQTQNTYTISVFHNKEKHIITLEQTIDSGDKPLYKIIDTLSLLLSPQQRLVGACYHDPTNLKEPNYLFGIVESEETGENRPIKAWKIDLEAEKIVPNDNNIFCDEGEADN